MIELQAYSVSRPIPSPVFISLNLIPDPLTFLQKMEQFL